MERHERGHQAREITRADQAVTGGQGADGGAQATLEGVLHDVYDIISEGIYAQINTVTTTETFEVLVSLATEYAQRLQQADPSLSLDYVGFLRNCGVEA